jgi:hypothetical protein
LSSCCIEDWTFSKKSIYIIAILFLVFISLHGCIQKSKNTFIVIIILHVKLANQYLQLLVGLTTFSISKDTTIDLLHLGVITAGHISPLLDFTPPNLATEAH